MSIAANIEKIKQEYSPKIKLIAVSKTQSNQAILEAYNSGHKFFAENKVQELCTKQSDLPSDIEWHLIGHLQTNKVKFIAQFVHLIHSVDSKKLLLEINKQAAKHNRIQKVLLQVFIAEEETKFGLSKDELFELLNTLPNCNLSNIEIVGLMGMASNTENELQIRNEFASIKKIFDEVKSSYFKSQNLFCELSIGMSSDYLIAVDEGSTMLRIGSLIFGERVNK